MRHPPRSPSGPTPHGVHSKRSKHAIREGNRSKRNAEFTPTTHTNGLLKPRIIMMLAEHAVRESTSSSMHMLQRTQITRTRKINNVTSYQFSRMCVPFLYGEGNGIATTVFAALHEPMSASMPTPRCTLYFAIDNRSTGVHLAPVIASKTSPAAWAMPRISACGEASRMLRRPRCKSWSSLVCRITFELRDPSCRVDLE